MNKLRHFWKEWGMTKKELVDMLAVVMVFLLPFALRIILAFFGI